MTEEEMIQESFEKFGFKVAVLAIDPDNAPAIIEEWCKTVTEKLLNPLDNYSKPSTSTSARIVKASRNDTPNDVATVVIEELTSLLTPDVLADTATLAHIINKLDDVKKFLGSVIEHNAAREHNVEQAQFANRKAIHEDYKIVRKGIIKVAAWFAKDVKVDEILPIRPGNFGDGVKSGVQATTPFYDWSFNVDDQEFQPGEDWFVIARAVGISLVNPKPLTIMDFMEQLESAGNFKFSSRETTVITSFTFNGHNITMMKGNN